MCGRYADHVEWVRRWADLLGQWPEAVEQSYNKAPSQLATAFTLEGGQAMRWGLVPAWSKEPVTKYATFNARMEDVESKPAYRSAWREARRCLIPALGYYEWQKTEGRKQPYFIHDTSGDPLFFAGLWEAWHRDDQSLLSCTILTREAVSGIAHIHDRMPVCVRPERLRDWLEGPMDSARAIVAEDVPERLGSYPVNPYVNNARNEGEGCIEPLNAFL